MRRLGRGAMAAGAVLVVAGLALPIAWAIVASLTPEAELFKAPGALPRHPVLEHYRALFAQRAFWLPIRNSLVVAAATTLLAVALGALAAYALARLRFRGRRLILIAVLASSVFPQISIVSPLYLVLRRLGWIDTYPGLVLPYLAFSLPLAVWLLTGFFRSLPAELEEAARVDGASRLRALREVILPLSAPGVVTTAILTFLYSWNELLFALSFTLGPERQTVPVAIALLRGRYQVPWGEILAASVVATVPVALLVLVCERWLVRGLTAGAVKG